MMKNDWFGYSYRFSSGTDIGRKRSDNQDRIILCPEISFFAVIDGMGGLPDSMRAVQTLAKTLPALLQKAANAVTPETLTAETAANMLKSATEAASDKVFSKYNVSGWGMGGAALVCIWLVNEFAVFAGLGDCRGYILRDGKELRQITEDHNVAGEWVRKGLLTKAQAMSHPTTSRLVRFAGMEAPAEADCFTEAIQPGDNILLCSDGLHGQVYEQDMTGMLLSGSSPKTICRELIGAANEAGGNDNVSVLCIQIGQK